LWTVFLLWMVGSAQRTGRLKPWVAGLAVLAIVFSYVGAVLELPKGSAATHVASLSGVEPWSEARVAAELRRGKPVFVYFTADWCLTCKVNETTAIDRTEVRDAFRRAGVELLAGDWTNGDPAITRFLESRGRAGVPLYLWYAPGKAPEELPQVLTPAMLISRAQAVRR
jgi:thiol:disulfide interchange protein